MVLLEFMCKNSLWQGEWQNELEDMNGISDMYERERLFQKEKAQAMCTSWWTTELKSIREGQATSDYWRDPPPSLQNSKNRQA